MDVALEPPESPADAYTLNGGSASVVVMIDTSALSDGNTHIEAYDAMYFAFCVDRNLDMDMGENTWSDEDTVD